MGRDDALLAFDRHATSKIASFDDLERVATLGFRGEALASIAAVARVELTTAEQPGEGHRVVIEGGRVRVAEPFARPRGTTIDVRSLFFNVPARRKFLKAPQTELRRCVEVVQGYALARPDVRFQVFHEGRELLDALPAPGTAAGSRERIGQIFGPELARELAEIPETRTRAGKGRTIRGFVGTPATARGRRQFIYVNRRLIRDRAVLANFYRAVRDEWRSEDFPALFLFLDIAAGGGGRQRPSAEGGGPLPRSRPARPRLRRPPPRPGARPRRGGRAAPAARRRAVRPLRLAGAGGEARAVLGPPRANLPRCRPRRRGGAPRHPHPARHAVLRPRSRGRSCRSPAAAARPAPSACWASTRGR